MNGHRAGIALIATVLALVVLEAAIAGALFLATLEVRTTRMLTARAHAELAAESAIAATIAGWDAAAIAALPLHATRTFQLAAPPHGPTLQADIEHIASGTYMIRAPGTAGATAARAGADAAALVRWFAPAAFAAATPAALTVGGSATVQPGAIVNGDLTPSTCTSADSLARAAFPNAAGIATQNAGAVTTYPGASPTGSPPILVSATATAPMAFAYVGALDTARLARASGRVESGVLTLTASSVAGACDTTAAANWGAPASPSHPCADYVPIVHAPANLTIAGGSGQALLFVAGDLTVDSTADFHGFALVLGDATIDGRIHGAIRVRGAADIRGEIRRDPCALWRAFSLPAALARPHRGLPRWRLPAF